MKTYCVKWKKDIENLDSTIFKPKNGRLIMQSKCSVCGIKKLKNKKRKVYWVI